MNRRFQTWNVGPPEKRHSGVYWVLHSGTSFPDDICQGPGWGFSVSTSAVCSSEEEKENINNKSNLSENIDKTQIQLKPKGWCDSRHMKNKTWPFNTVINFLVKKVYFTSSELKMFIPHFLIKWMVRKTILYKKPRSNKFSVGIYQSEKQSESNR